MICTIEEVNELCNWYNALLKYCGYKYTVEHCYPFTRLSGIRRKCMRSGIPFSTERNSYSEPITNFMVNNEWYKVCNPVDFRRENNE